MKILTINTGSSSCKIDLFDFTQKNPHQSIWEASLDWGKAPTDIQISVSNQKIKRKVDSKNLHELLREILPLIWSGKSSILKDFQEINCIVHRVVHGGTAFIEPTQFNKDVKEKIQQLAQFAPLHNPINLEGLEICSQLLPNIPQWVIFDTAFHHTLPEYVYTYPIPLKWKKQGLRKYGFHGISHEYCSHKASEIVQRPLQDLRIVNCHLGNGSSLAAIKGGKSINTTMGFSPLDGLMMGTRSGTIDTSAVLHLAKDTSNLAELLTKESGIKGIIKDSGDMRNLLEEMQKGNSIAKLAFKMYIQILQENIGRMIVSLNGLDVLIFTGGIGENVPLLREEVVSSLKFLQALLDPELNQRNLSNSLLSKEQSKVSILVIHTQENWQMAKSTYKKIIFPYSSSASEFKPNFAP